MGQTLQQGSAFGSGTARATAGDRIYHAIKASVIAYAFPEGKRIYLEPIAEDLNVSTTPVREALNRLAAEGLVIKAPRKGFLAMSLASDKLLGHYEMTKLLLVHELEELDADARSRLSKHEAIAEVLFKLNRRDIKNPEALAAYTAEIFRQFAALSGNTHVVHSINRANDHLHYIRTVEYSRLPDIQGELIMLCELLLGGHHEELVKTVQSYHDTRIELLPELFELAKR